ncbi:hypothetical protein ACNKU7_12525 [Microbulbifer sp. SA54]|uniref:DUF7878 domain-containing protein n=1 Tax=Microbulbifer sp. SA54 TaxID=3401577 RepID=UPI003AAA9002
MIELLTENFEIDPHGLKIQKWWQALINIQATFVLKVNGEKILEEPSWCVVEMAQALKMWELQSNWRTDFSYESMDEDEPELLWFRRTSDETWHVGSAWQISPANSQVSTEQLRNAVDQYCGQVERSVAR